MALLRPQNSGDKPAAFAATLNLLLYFSGCPFNFTVPRPANSHEVASVITRENTSHGVSCDYA